jgi:hypothetical protein
MECMKELLPLKMEERMRDSSRKDADPWFPAWGGEGIAIEPILNHVDSLFRNKTSLEGIERHYGAEILYVVDNEGFWGSDFLVTRDKDRVAPTEQLNLLAAYQLIMNESNNNRTARVSRLRKVVKSVGLPYWAWYGDWKSCAYQNAPGNNNSSDTVPLFTTCALRECRRAFPSPSYATVIGALENTSEWQRMFAWWESEYPWESKLRKVVWRGSLWENVPSKVYDSQRWRFMRTVTEMNGSGRDLYDAGFTGFFPYLIEEMNLNTSLVGGTVEGVAMHDFQRYVATIDLDGNSWSSRFGSLLCFNSVVIKVEPSYVDYFFYDLLPWKHYVPVRDDLSDLQENVAFVLDPANEDIVREIVAAANQWCGERLVRTELARDLLDLWETYVEMLDRADPMWTAAWKQKKPEVFATGHLHRLEGYRDGE